jgi:N-methylhydantoinase A/oxoprolinase/acetone carboxylase beta subunit
MSYFLGIDTGGTFTDAVLLDAERNIIASAKSLTTRFDLAHGIGASLDKLPPQYLAQVGLVSLSTTLTTNSVVEGRGAPICVLLAGYDAAQIKSSGLIELLGGEAIVALPGGHDAGGQPVHPLDAVASREAIVRHAPRVSAFAISASFAVRNPEHELQLRGWVEELTDKPVTCGHELASSLGAPRRAMTVALNARMIFHVKALIESVRRTLVLRNIDAPLMMVKGDGSLINAASALQRPVGTVLSGPAASVLGACALSGLQDAIVADMGGTTTDIAVVRNGMPELSFDGAMIGQWRPMVEAVKVYAIGLGGDSEVRFLGGSGLAIGPRRVLPLSLLAHEHPEVLAVMQRQQSETPHASQIRFVKRLQADAAMLSRLPEDELQAWERLAQSPVDMERANQEDRVLARALARLERKGLAIYSGFTPSDAAHVLNMSNHWNSEAARLGAIIWARQMRHLYGLGKWVQGDAVAPSRQVVDKVIDTICQKLVEAGLNDAGQMSEGNAGKMATMLTQLALHHRNGTTPRQPVFALQFSPAQSLVAVGAPAASYYPRVANDLGVALVLPAHAEVANAVGAVLGQVAQRVHLTVTQPVRGVFRVFTQSGPRDFENLEAALVLARQLAGDQARHMAMDCGAATVTLAFSQEDNSVTNDIDGNMFFEARVTATASGPPAVRAPARSARAASAADAADAADATAGDAVPAAPVALGAELQAALAQHGLRLRGGWLPGPADGLPLLPGGRAAAVVWMVGMVGSECWDHFRASVQFADGLPNPMDRWSQSIGSRLAQRFAGVALYPSDGPVYWPFQQWAARAEPLQRSPLNLSMHPQFGLWHAYRFALALPALAASDAATLRAAAAPGLSHCLNCADQPCLSACPVDAFSGAAYDVPACAGHLHSPQGQDCMSTGCLARRACPVAADLRYLPEHAAFHMAAFARAH